MRKGRGLSEEEDPSFFSPPQAVSLPGRERKKFLTLAERFSPI
jgi:hypothetical protein